MVHLKDRGRVRGVIVSGCLAERDRDTLLEACPGVDQLVGVFSRDAIAEAAGRVLGNLDAPRTLFRPALHGCLPDDGRMRLTPPHVAFLKISEGSEGCDRQCAFCMIPSIRGKHQSKPIGQVVSEVEALVEQGTRELVLIAQDTSYYGIDAEGQPRLAALLGRLDEVEELEWIRVMYLYPMHVTDALVDVIASGRKILPYLDLPLQHINDRILRRMRRDVGRAETEALIDRLRGQIDNLVLRTTLMAGFPGETEAEFEELLEFVRQRRFERLGAFAYSLEEDTPSARLDGHLPDAVRQQRRDAILAQQQPIAFAFNASQVGRRLEVLIDGVIAGEANACVGRSYADAPEVDGLVYVTGKGLAPGQIVPCEIVATQQYDLIGVAVGLPR
jgi:ribosomal protein S12 methylthiotransferase